MLAEIWEKRIPCIIQLCGKDVCDSFSPLPLILHLSWNHYIGLYYPIAKNFFRSCLPYPVPQSQFWMQLASGQKLQGIEIVSHLITLHEVSLPLRILCHFRASNPGPRLDIKRHFKNSLKASTALRYGKKGAAVITVEMSVEDVDAMYAHFINNLYCQYLGNQQHFGYNFVVGQETNTPTIPVRIISKGILVERGVLKEITLRDFLKSIIDQEGIQINDDQILTLFPLKLHGVKIKSLNEKFDYLQRYSHPDGYLYFIL